MAYDTGPYWSDQEYRATEQSLQVDAHSVIL
jgi:hypothetical protein